jgi:hypothetical protein
MRKLTLTAAAATLAVALPGVAQADNAPSNAATQTASQLCRAERGTTDATRAAFATKYGTNKNKKNAFGKCVSQQAKVQRAQAEGTANDAAEVAAAKACSAERGTTAASRAAFADKYGTNKNKRNAFGKCVSQKSSVKDDA